MFVLGHLVPGTSVEQARVEARRIAADLVAEFPESNLTPDGHPFGIGLNGLHDQTVGTTGRALGIFLGASGLLLLLAAMNAGTLLLARSLDRTQELSVRIALGAGRSRVVRLLVSEAGVLSALGGAFGVLLAYGGVGIFLRYAPPSIPRLSSVSVDGRVLAVAAVVSLGTGIAVGLLPALHLTRWGPWERLQGAGRSVAEPTSRLRSGFVGGQMAVAVVLLSGAGLLFGSFMRIRAVDPGFEPEGLITMTARPATLRKGDSQSPWIAWNRMVAEIGTLPGVESVAGSSNLPFQSSAWSPRLLLPDDSPETVREGVVGYAVTPGYLETMSIELLQGRGIEFTDGPNAEHVALVNESFVRTQLGGRSPINLIVRRVAEGDGRRDQVDEILPMRIVGVVADAVQARAEDGPRPA
ncbi:MAG: FtsX-like permease family protein, partial [Longimicrobiales bacterium]